MTKNPHRGASALSCRAAGPFADAAWAGLADVAIMPATSTAEATAETARSRD
ncbi:hypothetical protein J2S55_009208 [Streptosporangium brasiliense]|uniref:Uncharacterized protein n=1 Tax=Streptosporangium brasiliense TaxID=47480 RepID=A0ABT9RKY0_9ACTN|nr:hypothetical protein [Streptosporangium brasiliense]